MEKIDPYVAPVMNKLKSYKGDFVCSCGDEIDQEFISLHLNDCSEMQDQYGDLFQALNILIEDSPFKGTINNIQAVTTFFRNKLQKVIAENSKPSAIDEQGAAPIDHSNVGQEDDGLFMSCTKCCKKFNDFDMSQIIFLESCSHILCKSCFEDIVKSDYIKKQMAECPQCSVQIPEYEIKGIIGEEPFEKIQHDSLRAVVEGDKSLVMCPCGNAISVEEGKIDYNVKDDKGRKISKIAAQHMSKYRVRCNACKQNFCTNCNLQPYHIGKTCEEHKEFSEAIKCRFCGKAIEAGPGGGAFRDVCNSKDCKNMIKQSCDKVLECGHPCKGFIREKKCLPCLNPECVEKNPDVTMGEDDDSFCSICFVSGLGEQPSIQLGCRHIFHVDCIAEKIRQKWSGPRITFLFKTCPSCKQEIEAPHHPELNELLEEASKMEEEIRSKALERAKHEGLDKDERLKKPGDVYYNNLEAYAIARLSYYTCYECKVPYFGGLKDCGNLLEAEANFKEEELVCGKCSSKHLDGKVDCPSHGTDYIEFKCRYC